MIQDFSWQEQALLAWQQNNHNGTVKAATGTGKTLFAIKCIKSFQTKPSVLIVVPTIALCQQWKQDLIAEGCPESLVGTVGDGKNEFDKKYVVGVINSVRDNIFLNKDFLILDECHKALSTKNIKVLKRKFKYLLALSATPERDDLKHNSLLALAPLVFNYGLDDGIQDNILSKYKLINIKVSLSWEELKLHQEIDGKVRDGMVKFGGFDAVKRSCYRGNIEASEVLKLIQRRRQLLLSCANKPRQVLDIIKSESSVHTGLPKTIVFCEYIETAETIKDLLQENSIKTAIYHSKLKTKERAGLLESYRNGDVPVLVSVKCLDEGLNVPLTEIGIITGGTSTRRQAVQRIGRILRGLEDKTSKLYQLYVPGSKDYEWCLKRTQELQQSAEEVTWV